MAAGKPYASFNSSNNSDGSKNLEIKLVIYDFDQTITCDHLYHELNGGQEDELNKMADDKLLDIYGGNDRLQRLKQHFQLIKSANCELVIISFNFVKVIQNALKRMGLHTFFDTRTSIIGRDSQLLSNLSKADCIAKLKSDKQLHFTQILFIDDDNTNIQQTTSLCESIQSILIKQRKGMTDTHMQDIESKCGYAKNRLSKNWTYACSIIKEWKQENKNRIPNNTAEWETVIESEIMAKLYPSFEGKNDIEQLACRAVEIEIDIDQFNEQKQPINHAKVIHNVTDDVISVQSRVSSVQSGLNYQIDNIPIVNIHIIEGDVSDNIHIISHGSIIGVPIKKVNSANGLVELFKGIESCVKEIDVIISKAYFVFVQNWAQLSIDKNVNDNTLFLYIRFASRNDNATFHLLKETYKQKLGFNIIIPVKKPRTNKRNQISKSYVHTKHQNMPVFDNNYQHFKHPSQLFNEKNKYDKIVSDKFNQSYINQSEPINNGNNINNVNNGYNNNNQNNNNVNYDNNINNTHVMNDNNNNNKVNNEPFVKNINDNTNNNNANNGYKDNYQNNDHDANNRHVMNNNNNDNVYNENNDNKIDNEKFMKNVNNNVENNNVNNGKNMENNDNDQRWDKVNQRLQSANQYLQKANEAIARVEKGMDGLRKENQMLKQTLSMYENNKQ